MKPTRRLLDDCFLHDKDRLRHQDALALLADRLSPIAGVKNIYLGDALGQVLVADILAPRPIPAHTNAAVDGYAVHASSLTIDDDSVLPVALRIAAGHQVDAELQPNAAARIFTGAGLPRGADAVVMQEDCEVTDNGNVIIPAGVTSGMNVRRAGEDVAIGDRVARAGERVSPQLLAAIASTGAGEVSCYAPLRVAVVSSGDEVIRPGEMFSDGKVYDSNHYLLAGLLSSANVLVSDLGILPDDAQIVRDRILQTATSHDVIITTGGASRGEEDHMVNLVADEGKLHGWQLAIKPGRPLAFGQLGDCVFLGLPGNPVAAFVCFLLYARPMFAHLQGANWIPPQSYQIAAGFSILKKKPDRREFWRGWIEDGRLKKFDRDGSGLISGLTAATGLIEIPEEVTDVGEGDMLTFIPYASFGVHF